MTSAEPEERRGYKNYNITMENERSNSYQLMYMCVCMYNNMYVCKYVCMYVCIDV